MSVPQSIRDALRSAAACVTGSARRSIQAWVAKTYCHGSPRHTETVFGWNRRTVESGIRESESQEESRTEQETRGRPAVEITPAKQLPDCLTYAICGFAGRFLLAGCLTFESNTLLEAISYSSQAPVLSLGTGAINSLASPSAPLATVLDLFPNLCPLSTPLKWLLANDTCFFGEMRLLVSQA